MIAPSDDRHCRGGEEHFIGTIVQYALLSYGTLEGSAEAHLHPWRQVRRGEEEHFRGANPKEIIRELYNRY